MKLQFDVWQHNDMTTLCLAGSLGEESRTLLEPDAKHIHSLHAESHFDAMTQYYQFMGFGAYTSDYEDDKTPFDEHQFIRAKVRKKLIGLLAGHYGECFNENDETLISPILNTIVNEYSLAEITDSINTVAYKINIVHGNNTSIDIAKQITSIYKDLLSDINIRI